MKTILFTLGLVLSYTASAQWTYKTIDNGFDDPYKIAYTAEDDGSWLKLENIDGEISFYIGGGYTCDENLTVDLSFMVNGVYKKYSYDARTSSNKDNVFFIENLLNAICLADFKACSSVKVRVNDTTCDTETYEFKMSGSTAAFNFMVNE
jgi:hypothetical protein